jgi:hypothetical protein
MASNFKKLLVYQRSRALADELHSLVIAWPPFDRDSLGMQLMCAVDSVSANIAEAGGRWTLKDHRDRASIERPDQQTSARCHRSTTNCKLTAAKRVRAASCELRAGGELAASWRF